MVGKPFKKGNIPWNTGKKESGMTGKTPSAETRQKISDAKAGVSRKPFSKEWKQNMSDAQRGKTLSDEHKDKIRKAHRSRVVKEKLIYISPRGYQKIKKRVLERDGYTCQECGETYKVEVHHIIKRKHRGENIMENLITLCPPCHKHAERK